MRHVIIMPCLEDWTAWPLISLVFLSATKTLISQSINLPHYVASQVLRANFYTLSSWLCTYLCSLFIHTFLMRSFYLPISNGFYAFKLITRPRPGTLTMDVVNRCCYRPTTLLPDSLCQAAPLNWWRVPPCGPRLLRQLWHCIQAYPDTSRRDINFNFLTW